MDTRQQNRKPDGQAPGPGPPPPSREARGGAEDGVRSGFRNQPPMLTATPAQASAGA